MKSVLAIRHVAFEDAGSFASILAARNFSLRYLDAGVDSFSEIDPLDSDLLIVLGGPIGVYEEESYPFLVDEIDFIRTRLKKDLPTLGICLGSQLIAKALGASVYPGPQKEIGWKPLTLTEAGKSSPVSPLAGNKTSMLHWHGDTFDLPQGATLLASTDVCKHQVYSVGKNVIAFQCHPEACAATMERWLIGHTCELGHAKISVPDLRTQIAHHGKTLESQGAKFFTEWLDSLGALPPDPRQRK
jgi:GMP synthase (glutamine-hydrolysing)